jgi:hypothetical protein
LDEATATGNVAGYNTPAAFSDGGRKDKKRKKKIATSLGYSVVGNDVNNIDEAQQVNLKSVDVLRRAVKKINKTYKVQVSKIGPTKGEVEIELGSGNHPDRDYNTIEKLVKKLGIKRYSVFNESVVNEAKIKKVNKSKWNRMKFDDKVTALLSVVKDPDDAEEYAESNWEDLPSGFERDMVIYESINEAKVKRPVNRWLELKNDESMHPHKKMAMGLKELKYQLAETQKFFNWYNKIKTMNELDSDNYWKRTNKHIYKIKERLINIARTIQEIEK